jgi:hypothetical protein
MTGRQANGEFVGMIPKRLQGVPTEHLVLFRDGAMVGPVKAGEKPDTLVVAPADWSEDKVKAMRFEVVKGKLQPMGELRHYSGYMYGANFMDLVAIADNTTPTQDGSPVFVFEDEKQLEFPHSIHADIANLGAGRFSHWGQELLFASSDNTDPRENGRAYRVVIADDDTKISA